MTTFRFNPDGALVPCPVPEWPGAWYGQHLDPSVAALQRAENGIRNTVLDCMRVVVDAYAPRSVRRQVRFPRSKKRRIRNKWARDPRNWREFACMWLVDTRQLRNSRIVTWKDGAL